MGKDTLKKNNNNNNNNNNMDLRQPIFLTAWQHHWLFIYIINLVLFQCGSPTVQGFVQSMLCIYQVLVFVPCVFKFN